MTDWTDSAAKHSARQPALRMHGPAASRRVVMAGLLCLGLSLCGAMEGLAIEPPTPPDRSLDGGRTPEQWATILRKSGNAHLEARSELQAARRNLDAGEIEKATESLARASTLDPNYPEARRIRSQVDARNGDSSAIGEWIESWRLRFTGYPNQAAQLSRVFLFVNLFAAILLVWWSLHLLIHYLPFWHHRLASAFDAKLHRENAHRLVWLALAAIALGVASRGLIPFVALAFVAIWPMAHRRIRVTLTCLITWFAFQGLYGEPFGAVLAALDPQSEVSLMAAARDEAPTGSLLARFERARAERPENRSLLFAEGLVLARAGSFAASNERFLGALEANSEDALSTNNLANNHYYLGDVDRAVAGYQRSAAIDATRGETFHNLSQAHLRKLFMKEGGEAMRRAVANGFAASRQPQPLPEGGVYYSAPTATELWMLAWHDRGRLQPLDLISGQQWLLGVPLRHAGIWLLGGLLLGMAFSRIFGRDRLAYQCANCLTLACQHCSGDHEGLILCGGCAQTAKRARSEVVLATLLRNRRIEAEARSRRQLRTWNVLAFGVGHVRNGMQRRGVVMSLLFCAFVIGAWSPQLPQADLWLIPEATLFSAGRIVSVAGLVLLGIFSWLGRVPLKIKSLHLHPGSLVSLSELIEGRSKRRASA